jgi:murein DD-endopeptidase MepM/ murein hydrolase activator NlpD
LARKLKFPNNSNSNYFTDYLHLQNNSEGGINTPLSIGSRVLQNTIVGYSGSTGPVKGAHLHSGIYFDSIKANPYANWLKMQGINT